MMSRKEVLEKLTEICRDVFDDDELIINDSTAAEDVETWDSLTYLSLISEIEDAFDISLTLKETSSASNIGELIDAISNHLT